jgi:hypothetical protein
MKVGVHAGEPFEQIIERKHDEELSCGRFLWGYGGTLCHPRTQVAPFVTQALAAGAEPLLVMLRTSSKHVVSGPPAADMSVDGREWRPISASAMVTSSRYALVCRGLRQTLEEVNLSEYRVAVGRSQGSVVSRYMKGRVDKACARLAGSDLLPEIRVVAYVAELTEPYAVFMR